MGKTEYAFPELCWHWSDFTRVSKHCHHVA